ncbi:MAG: BlaI/MecI/CopY family transcriptional regulator [Actinobacteria bacterium]|nr:BlaI/MecI/CopY family transcriptional regulator [Actinomycetota bacterium]
MNEVFMMAKGTDLKKKSEEIGINGLNSISNLEADIMKIVWERKKVTVREVHEYMLRKEIENKKEGFIPYTTVMSTMTTLAEKGLLKQDKSSKTYIYSAAVDNKELSKSIIRSVAEKLLEEPAKKIISSFFEDSSRISISGIEKLLKEIK